MSPVRHVRAASLALSLACLAPTLAQVAAPALPPPPQLPGKENAALLYYRAWDLLAREDSATVGDTFENKAACRLTPDQIKALEANQPYVELVMRAASTPECDWGIQYDQGWEALLPHLSKMRQTCRFLGADARRCFDAGRPAEGAERLAAIIRMAEQTRGDGILISALVGAAMAMYSTSATSVAFELNALTPDSARIILNALREIHQEDLFGSRTSILFEAWGSVEWPKARFTGATAGREYAALLSGAAQGGPERAGSPLDGMDAARLAVELDKGRAFYDEAYKVWNEPDAVVQLDALAARVAAGEFGEAARVVVPALGKARQGIEKTLGAINTTIKDLETFIATGQTPADVAGAVPAGQ
jgi:hypothetical protein